MKRFCVVAMVLLTLTSFTSCESSMVKNTTDTKNDTIIEETNNEISSSNIDASINTDENNGFIKFPVLFEETNNYKIYATEEITAFRYYVYSNDGGLLDEGFHDYRGSIKFFMDNDYLISEDTDGFVSHQYKYYDLDRCLVSCMFSAPCRRSGKLIAYFTYKNDDGPFLIVQDIFEPSLYYKEFEWNYPSYLFRDPSSVTFEFLNNNTELQITYLNENSNEYDTVVYDLRG